MARVNPATFEHPPFAGHVLLDSGDAEKLERFGEVVLRRPDPQALWSRSAKPEVWERAHLRFVRESDRGGRWEVGPDAPAVARESSPEWPCHFGEACFLVRPTAFKHLGVFPEQAANWRWVSRTRATFEGEPPRLLNLFGYTGSASVLALQAGYQVTHVDASRTAIAWALDNLEASGLSRKAMRVICDDALAFARREVRRGTCYEGVLLDPPHYGRGPAGETWQFEESIATLLEAVAELLAPRSFLVLSTYAMGTSPLALANLLAELEGGEVRAGELALPREGGGPALPAGFCARWSRDLACAR